MLGSPSPPLPHRHNDHHLLFHHHRRLSLTSARFETPFVLVLAPCAPHPRHPSSAPAPAPSPSSLSTMITAISLHSHPQYPLPIAATPQHIPKTPSPPFVPPRRPAPAPSRPTSTSRATASSCSSTTPPSSGVLEARISLATMVPIKVKKMQRLRRGRMATRDKDRGNILRRVTGTSWRD
jgi:hypothetical protein